MTSVSNTSESQIKKRAIFLLLISTTYGLLASFVLTMEKIHSLIDPVYVPSCSINPIISCANAMNSAQAELFGIPNSLFGIIAYTAFFVIAMLLLVGVKFPKLIWIFLGIGSLLAVIFVHYLIIESIFFMHVICPWCFGLWITTPLLFIAIIKIGVSQWRSAENTVAKFVQNIAKHSATLLTIWYVVLAAAIITVFWEFWASLMVVPL